MIFSWRTP
uniref:Uncharacterized protein n=1 Tax=Arundo donax TaxID=35708 RepID=A0A0A9GE82_ARUDO